MKRSVKIIALALGSLLVAASFAACGGKSAATETAGGRICFDNLGGATSYLNAADTRIVVAGAKNLKGYDKDGEAVDYKTIATYDAGTGTFTAVSEGKVTCTVNGKIAYTLEVVPAYVTDPGNQYMGNVDDWSLENGDAYLGNTHDPSYIEAVNTEGGTDYYLFSTGWATGNDVHVSHDGMLTWEYVGKTTQRGDYDNEKIFPSELKEWMNSQNNDDDIQWWAPDIVPAQGGGYWFYTCLVMDDDRMPMLTTTEKFTPSGVKYSRACIVMYYIKDINAIGSEGALEYKGVLMQSAIPQDGKGTIDVNAIDPQIIYTPAGDMYMAFGSFGTGNWIIELNPQTGLRKDGDNEWHEWTWVRRQRNKVVSDDEETGEYGMSAANTTCGKALLDGEGYTHPYYGQMISVGNMEAPVIARHDNVKVADESATYGENGEPENVEGKTYYYSMHSYNWLAGDYQMWGGRSESVTGAYLSTGGGNVYNVGVNNSANQGNKYMGGFDWQASSKVAGCKEYAACLTGHNDLYTTKNGINMAAYIVRRNSNTGSFLVQNHQYYLNSMGDICLNPNRYAGEIDRSVSEDELFALTDGGKFEMVVLTNAGDWSYNNSSGTISNISKTVTLDKDTKEVKLGSTVIGSYVMYGKGYIKFTFTETLKGSGSYDSHETVYYGVVRPAWLVNRNQSGFTISCMGNTEGTQQSMAMFMNSYSTID